MGGEPWMKKKRRTVTFGFMGFLVLIVIVVATYPNNVGYDNVKQIYRLETTSNSVIQIDSIISGKERYLTKEKNDPQELLKSRMLREGWVFKEQEGSGYFFEKDGRNEIVTMQKWNHFYVIYDLNEGVANLED